MKKILHLMLPILLCMYSIEAQARVAIINQCEITPQIWLPKTPPVTQKTNNLRRLVGSSQFASGNPIIIEGVIMDDACVPISDAMVEIWQANSKGWFDYNNVLGEKSDPNFIGTGSTVTDNMGIYNFITVMPGSIHQMRAPHINIRVRHKDFPVFESIIYFENRHLNSKDVVLNKEVKPAKRNLLIAKERKYSKNGSEYGVLYRLNITIDGQNKYKKY